MEEEEASWGKCGGWKRWRRAEKDKKVEEKELESGKNREIRVKERKRKIKGDLSLEVSRMENWVLDGTTVGQVHLFNFRKKLKRDKS